MTDLTPWQQELVSMIIIAALVIFCVTVMVIVSLRDSYKQYQRSVLFYLGSNLSKYDPEKVKAFWRKGIPASLAALKLKS